MDDDIVELEDPKADAAYYRGLLGEGDDADVYAHNVAATLLAAIELDVGVDEALYAVDCIASADSKLVDPIAHVKGHSVKYKGECGDGWIKNT